MTRAPYAFAPLNHMASARQRLDIGQRILRDLRDGLAGKPFRWGGDAAHRWEGVLAMLGIVLETETALARRHHELRRDMKPVGSIYFAAPIGAHHDVYVVGVQTRAIRLPTSADRPDRAAAVVAIEAAP